MGTRIRMITSSTAGGGIVPWRRQDLRVTTRHGR